MATDLHRDELLLVLLASADIALDAESVAATYHTSVEEWRRSLERLEEEGLVESLGDGLYVLTTEGEKQVAPRGTPGGSVSLGSVVPDPIP